MVLIIKKGASPVNGPLYCRPESCQRGYRVANSEELKKTGLKVTAQRLKILELFQKAQARGASCHLSAEEVYRALLDEGETASLATVYRVLTQFEQAGLLDRQTFASGRSVFELNEGRHHDHIVCLQCGHVEEFFDEEIEARQAAVARKRHFAVKAHSLCLYADCLRKNCPNKA